MKISAELFNNRFEQTKTELAILKTGPLKLYSLKNRKNNEESLRNWGVRAGGDLQKKQIKGIPEEKGKTEHLKK